MANPSPVILDYAVTKVYHGERLVEQLDIVTGSDSRLADARNPLPHRHPVSDIDGLSSLGGGITGITARLDSGSTLGPQPRLNFITGSNVTLDLQQASDELALTIAALASGNLDGGVANSVYGGTSPTDGGGA